MGRREPRVMVESLRRRCSDVGPAAGWSMRGPPGASVSMLGTGCWRPVDPVKAGKPWHAVLRRASFVVACLEKLGVFRHIPWSVPARPGGRAMLAAFALGDAAEAALAPTPERVHFDSLAEAGGEPVRLEALLFRPQAPRPAEGRAAVIALHGCGGLYSSATVAGEPPVAAPPGLRRVAGGRRPRRAVPGQPRPARPCGDMPHADARAHADRRAAKARCAWRPSRGSRASPASTRVASRWSAGRTAEAPCSQPWTLRMRTWPRSATPRVPAVLPHGHRVLPRLHADVARREVAAGHLPRDPHRSRGRLDTGTALRGARRARARSQVAAGGGRVPRRASRIRRTDGRGAGASRRAQRRAPGRRGARGTGPGSARGCEQARWRRILRERLVR